MTLALLADPPAAFATEAERRRAVAERDGRADGHFVYAVRSTGVYCRPSCPSRAALPENVGFHASPEAAEAAGFRPCLRCRPNEAGRAERGVRAVALACRAIEEAETPPDLAALGRASGVSPSHLHRLFKGATGVSPRAYARAVRAARAGKGLREGASVTRALHEAGFNAASRFYAEAEDRLGMSPLAYRKGGPGAAIRFAVAPCSLGRVLVAATERGVCAILLGDDPEALRRDLEARFPRAELVAGAGDFEGLVARVVGLVERPEADAALPLDIAGTAFQERVWQALRAIPSGETATYTGIARAIGAPTSARAVARACGANPLAVAVPCHRVVGAGGALSGYRWGLERKRALLAREAAATEADGD
ncbi:MULTISPECIES: bifunctional DNA-binding transcriptional regulator/O6-methylguanine-DNA methyltransferase Ada [Methylobacterium]|uniref:Bifunctional transcriptional activator/DNA repair enzyme Ada n=4 Tax=Pseudomonadota TaxID=1224 RepID=A0ABQ4SZV0_9HYPH|nr:MULTISPECIES: bifunctional DNA-binding transcriptional regulator/O6-methylguanine-DNA methyltransferase Ada [Methylobacterium]PIU04708.1 MAG: bifunctional DNA-binding transcriptional regulator/O6-methylguanine-DNA methyltransferase Ada [Methylobacterium sp. CG09_land_8_20_14_0_10_71_15]PIU13213.1 MAG: bifunctional DNA-binding transcriptional regulator/O6-methylguanine-DNA methyltransferase Ada [Methylobacterium sp. CG08_land_8_20_14_0_20_71_15]GBU15950.1 bifunctional transcriptional activator